MEATCSMLSCQTRSWEILKLFTEILSTACYSAKAGSVALRCITRFSEIETGLVVPKNCDATPKEYEAVVLEVLTDLTSEPEIRSGTEYLERLAHRASDGDLQVLGVPSGIVVDVLDDLLHAVCQ